MNKIKGIARKIILNDITGNLGKIEESNDKIICHVNNKKLEKLQKGYYIFQLMFGGTVLFTRNFLDTYDINKPICYVIDGMNFDKRLEIYAPKDIIVKFKNCKFNKQIRIACANEIIFENNTYFDRYPDYDRAKIFMSGEANHIKFINDSFINSDNDHHPTRFGMDITVNNLSIVNSNFEASDKQEELMVKCNDISIINSTILCSSVYIDAENIEIDNSKIVAPNEIIIDEKNPNCENNNSLLNSIESPNIMYNGIEYTESKNTQKKDLQKYRELLIKELRNLKQFCAAKTNQQIEQERKKLNDRQTGLNSYRRLLIKQLAKIRDNCVEMNNYELEKEKCRLNKISIGQIIK